MEIFVFGTNGGVGRLPAEEMLHNPALAPQVLELNRGTTSIAEAVRASRR